MHPDPAETVAIANSGVCARVCARARVYAYAYAHACVCVCVAMRMRMRSLCVLYAYARARACVPPPRARLCVCARVCVTLCVCDTAARTTNDITPVWETILDRAHTNDAFANLSQPGYFNDPDMLEIGNGALTAAEGRSQLALWSIMRAPLLSVRTPKLLPRKHTNTQTQTQTQTHRHRHRHRHRHTHTHTHTHTWRPSAW